MKILIADDHQLLADALAELVKENEADAEILHADSLDDAMDKMDSDGAVEIVLVDYDLPGMGGVGGLERLRDRHPLLFPRACRRPGSSTRSNLYRWEKNSSQLSFMKISRAWRPSIG
jgi:CheY-like chemotaxis protein